MGKFIRYDRRKCFAALLLTVFLAYLCSNSLFTHIHLMEDAVISHSHFYAGTPDKPGHSHSQAQISLIAALSHFAAVESGIQGQMLVMLFLCGVVTIITPRLVSSDHTFHSLRAPPATMTL